MQDLLNKIFGKWTVISYEGKRNTERHWYKVKCQCGNESIVERNILKRGKTTQCRSCARKISTAGEKNPAHKHGYSSPNHPLFYMHYIWVSIKQRCTNPNVKNYHRYGGRGIKMSLAWANSFEQFATDMGERPKGYSIDRNDNEGNYCKENCKWVTKEQNCNNTYKSIIYEYEGDKLSETQWSRKLEISRNKFMWWVRKKGIQWVIDNIESIKLAKIGMSDQEYKDLGFELPDRIFKK